MRKRDNNWTVDKVHESSLGRTGWVKWVCDLNGFSKFYSGGGFHFSALESHRMGMSVMIRSNYV